MSSSLKIEDVFMGQQLFANSAVDKTTYTVREIDLAGSRLRVSWVFSTGQQISHPSWFALWLFKLGPMQLGEP